jgi:hypothetical protein
MALLTTCNSTTTTIAAKAPRDRRYTHHPISSCRKNVAFETGSAW